MPVYPVKSIIDGLPTFEKTLTEIVKDMDIGGALNVLEPLEYITYQQIKWFKGVLLTSLSKDTGDSREYWETVLKLAVLPDDFQPFYVPIGKQIFPVMPSITKLSKTKMVLLIEGSVAHLREERIYGDKFSWVTLPDKELRSK